MNKGLKEVRNYLSRKNISASEKRQRQVPRMGSEYSREASVAEVKWGEEEISRRRDQRPNRRGVGRSHKSLESPRKILSFSLSKIG